jgi:hypothetical protein
MGRIKTKDSGDLSADEQEQVNAIFASIFDENGVFSFTRESDRARFNKAVNRVADEIGFDPDEADSYLREELSYCEPASEGGA